MLFTPYGPKDSSGEKKKNRFQNLTSLQNEAVQLQVMAGTLERCLGDIGFQLQLGDSWTNTERSRGR